MKKRLTAIILLLSFFALNFQITIAATATTYDISEGNVAITESGDYIIEGTSTSNAVTVGVSGSEDIEVNLTLKNVNISSSTNAILIYSNATVNMTLEGDNYLTSTSTSTNEKYAGLAVLSSSSGKSGQLIIGGDGTLTAKGGRGGAGIGNYGTEYMGDIIINSGTITATGGTGGAGIGLDYSLKTLSGQFGSITINGGTVTATGGTGGAGIGIGSSTTIKIKSITINGGVVMANGGSTYSADIGGYGLSASKGGGNPPIIINGGYIKAGASGWIGGGSAAGEEYCENIIINGGSIDASIEPSAYISTLNSKQETVSKIILKMPDPETQKNQEVTINGWTTVTDDKGQIYPFVPSTTKEITVVLGDDTYYAALNGEKTEYTLELVLEEECICDQDTAYIDFELQDTVEVNLLKGSESVNLNAAFIPNENCEKKPHEAITYTVVDAKEDDAAMLLAAKEKLKEEILSAEALEESDYTSSSWSALQTKISDAETVYNNVDATQEQIDNALSNLKSAIEALVVSETPSPVPTEEVSETPSPVPTEEAGETPSPVPTEEAGETPSPVPTEEVSETASPDTEEEAGETPSPVPTEEVSETPSPVPTEEVSETASPDTEEEASETPSPVPTEEVSETPSPVPTEEVSETPLTDAEETGLYSYFGIKSFSSENELTYSDLTGIAEINDGVLTVYTNAIGRTLRIKASSENNGIMFTAYQDIFVVSNDDVELDIAAGNITIADSDTEGFHKVTVGSTVYNFEEDKKLIIIQSTKTVTQNKISSTAESAHIELSGVNMYSTASNPIGVNSEYSTLTITLTGDNKLESVSSVTLYGKPTASLTIDGSGSLTVNSGSNAGIAGFEEITINDGIVTSSSGGGASGIGAVAGSNGSKVTINGGKIKATGSLTAAGIGGGAPSSANAQPHGGDVTINAGTVVASTTNGFGIGGEGTIRQGASAHGTLTINGGSVNSTFGPTTIQNSNGEDVCLCTLTIEGLTGEHDVEYVIDDPDGEKIKTSTDSEGKLYLYLAKGERWIIVYYNETPYYYRVRSRSDTTSGECMANPVTNLTSFSIAGNSAEIDNDEHTITVTVPNNLDLSNVTSSAEFEGYSFITTTTDFSTDEDIKYTLLGYDATTLIYTLTINVDESVDPDAPSEFDISKGRVWIYSDFVDYGGTRFSPNDNGYIITGTSTDADKRVVIDLTGGDESIPITFKDLHVDYDEAYNVPPVNINSNATIKLEGSNSFSALDFPGIEMTKSASVTSINVQISGEGNLTAKGGAGKPAIGSASDETSSVIKTKIKGTGIIILEGGDGANAVSGTLITDSTTNMRLIENAETLTNAVDDDGTALYQTVIALNEKSAANQTCIYQNTTYTLDNDAAFYLMMPNNEYTIQAEYNNENYYARMEMNSNPVSIVLRVIGIESLEYESSIVYDARKLEIELLGYIQFDNTKIRLVPRTKVEGFNAIDASISLVDNKQIASIEFPVNTGENDIVYDVYGVINNEVSYTDSGTFTILGNDTLCNITSFTISGQIGDTVYDHDKGLITLYFPFDHNVMMYHTPTIEHQGADISPAGSKITWFNPNAVYTVTAKNGTTQKQYTVRLRNKTTPEFTDMSFEQPETSDETVVTVKLTGNSLENIDEAEQETNRIVTVSADGIEAVSAVAQADSDSGVIYYTADITVPENTDDNNAKSYELKVKIGDTEQSVTNTTLVSPRKLKSASEITRFALDNQVEDTEYDGNTIKITMPYDASITELTPDVEVSTYAKYEPTGSQNFSQPVKYRVTAENGEDYTDYTVTVTKQDTPTVSAISFTDPKYSLETVVAIELKGENLDNVQNAVNQPCNIVVNAALDGDSSVVASAVAEKTEDGTYIAYITIPKNEDEDNEKKYIMSVEIGGVEQSIDDAVLISPKGGTEGRELVSMKLTDDQTDEKLSGKLYTLHIPYNTDVRSIVPKVEHTGTSYSPTDAQDFNSVVDYTITGENGSNVYQVQVFRDGVAGVSNISFEQPETFAQTDIDVTVTGCFIPYLTDADAASKTLKDVIVVQATPSDGGEPVKAEMEYTKYSGEAVAHLAIPKNNSSDDVAYTITVSVNGVMQNIGLSGTVNIPRRKTRAITSFSVEGQTETPEITDDTDTGTIHFKVPYEQDLTSVTPEITIDGDDYSPKAAQDFTKAVTYTVTAEDDTPRTYTVTWEREGTPTLSGVKLSNMPENFSGSTVNVEFEGIFYDSAAVKAVPKDGGEAVNGVVTMTQEHCASAEIEIPANYDTVNEKEYTLVFTLDGFEDISYEDEGTITVPRRKTRAITSFSVEGQTETPEITDDTDTGTIHFKVPYEQDLTSVTPEITIDGDDYSPKAAQDFTKAVTYTVTAEDDTPRTYTVTWEREGTPTLSGVKLSNMPENFSGSTVNVEFEGIFYDSAAVKAVPKDGGEAVNGVVTMTQEHCASAEIEIPANYDTVNEKEYTLVFTLDGFEDISYEDEGTITVPRRKTRAITSFKVQGQIGETTISDDTVTFSMPYYTDLTNIEPEIEYDGDFYTPTGAQSFDNETESLKYTIYADGDEGREYTAVLIREGNPAVNGVSYDPVKNFNGGTLRIDVSGILLKEISATLSEQNGDRVIQGSVVLAESDSAVVEFEIPKNTNTSEDKKYNLTFAINGVQSPYTEEIIVPRRTTREITKFNLTGVQEGDARIEDTDIYVDVPYYLEINEIKPEIEYDADKIEPSVDEALNFSDEDNPIQYTLSSDGDTDVTYTIHIVRKGEDPYLKSFTTDNQTQETTYEDNMVYLKVKSSVNTKSLEPVIEFVGSDYEPKGAQDFSDSLKNPIVYTIKNEYGIIREYYVTIDKKATSGSALITKHPESTPAPTLLPMPSETPTPTQKAQTDTEVKASPSVVSVEKSEINPYINGYVYNENGYDKHIFMPERTMTRAEIAKILSVLDDSFNEQTIYSDAFSDIDSNLWYSNCVNYVAAKGYIVGYENNTYCPENMITRAEFAAIIARYIDIEISDLSDMFNDIADIEWCRDYINALAAQGIIKGYEDGTYKPSALVTRAEAVTIINRATNRNIDEKIINNVACPFEDVERAHWAYNDIIIASCKL